MKKKSNLILIIAVAVGLFCVFLIYKGFQLQRAEADQRLHEEVDRIRAEMEANGKAPVVVDKKPERPVVYAASPINAGQKIEGVFLKVQPTPNEILPGALNSMEEAVGKYATRSIAVGDALTPNNVTAQLQKMSARLTPGMRAMALPVFSGDANSTGGFAVDGDYVDLLLTYTESDKKESRTITVLQYVKILFNPQGQHNDQTDGINPVGSSPSSITFEVTPAQAEVLVQLLEAGTFHMVLRNSQDNMYAKTKGYSMPEFMENPKTAQARVLKSQIALDELLKQIKAKNDQPAPPIENKENSNESTPPTP